MATCGGDLSVRGHHPAVETRRRVWVSTLPVVAAILVLEPTALTVPAAAAQSCRVPALAACDSVPAPSVGARRRFRHRRSSIVTALGAANHRGRDLLLRPGDRQIAIAKFAYGPTDKDLVDEEVDVFLLRDYKGSWERVGTALTSDDGEHAGVEGIDDSGGRVYFEIPPAATLGAGRHRLHLSVAGDRTGADLVIQVAPAGTQFFIADIDGTLTTSGTAEFRSLVSGTLPAAHPFAPAALRALAARGYVPLYLSGRPEPLLNRTRAFLGQRGFPPGLVMTTARKRGAIGSAAARFKTETLARMLTARGFVATYAFGDTGSDAQAYASANVQHRLFYRYLDAAHGGRRFDSYRTLVADLGAAPLHCAR